MGKLHLLTQDRTLVDDAKLRLDACPVSKKDDRRRLSQLWQSRHVTYLKWIQHAEDFERVENIEKRWTEDDDRWIHALQHLRTRRYRRALDNLSRLLIQRLLELEKIGIGGTGMFGYLKVTFADNGP